MQHFLKTFKKQYQRPNLIWEPQTLKFLASHSWPGNVRELKNAIESLVATVPTDLIRIDDIPEDISGESPRQTETKEEISIPSSMTLDEVERFMIRQALNETGKNRKEAANMLGVSERTLYRKLKAENGQ